MMVDTIEITRKEYDDLVNAYNFLCLLYECGVDSWEGYAEAQELEGAG